MIPPVVVVCNPVGETRSLVKEARKNFEVGEVRSLEAGIVVVVDSHVAAPGLGRTLRRGMRTSGASPNCM